MSVRESLCDMLRLIRVDSLRRAHNVIFFLVVLIYHMLYNGLLRNNIDLYPDQLKRPGKMHVQNTTTA